MPGRSTSPSSPRTPTFPGTEAPRTEGFGVVGSMGPTGTPALVLQSHVDVVPTGDLEKWVGRDPWSGTISDGVVHGRGACDMKAGAAANLAVARALVTSGVVLERPFAMHSVISEEDGGLGAFATMLRGHSGDAAVLTEPTSGRIVVANAGALTFELRIAGRAAHGSTRLEGHSAIDAFIPINAAIAELERSATPARTRCSRTTSDPTRSRSRHGAGRRLGEQRSRPAGRFRPPRRAARRGARVGPAPRFRSRPSRWPRHKRSVAARQRGRDQLAGRAVRAVVASTQPTRSSRRSRARSGSSRIARRRGSPHRTAATCACTPVSAASRPALRAGRRAVRARAPRAGRDRGAAAHRAHARRARGSPLRSAPLRHASFGLHRDEPGPGTWRVSRPTHRPSRLATAP